MFSVALSYILAFLCISFLPPPQAAFFVNALPKPRPLPDVSSVASRGTSRQNNAFLDAHNAIRRQHGASPLIWSRDLADKAAYWADHCRLEHSGGALSKTNYGENIAAGIGGFSIKDAVAIFVDDRGQYNPSRPSYLRFTQVVWKSTTKIGCAVSECKNLLGPDSGSSKIHVCLYDPAGNVVGQANANVQV